MSDDIGTMGELSDDSDSDDSDTESLASSVAELSSGIYDTVWLGCMLTSTPVV